MNSIPKLQGQQTRLQAIPGNVPNLGNFPSGCRFHPRCPLAAKECAAHAQPLLEVEPRHWVRCPYTKP
jgi:peptide/nickel transport system ATP-binding protein